MRTTLTLDDDVARLLQQRAKASQLPFKKVVNDALRLSLEPTELPEAVEPFIPTFSLGIKPGIDPTKLTQYADELEDRKSFDQH